MLKAFALAALILAPSVVQGAVRGFVLEHAGDAGHARVVGWLEVADDGVLAASGTFRMCCGRYDEGVWGFVRAGRPYVRKVDRAPVDRLVLTTRRGITFVALASERGRWELYMPRAGGDVRLVARPRKGRQAHDGEATRTAGGAARRAGSGDPRQEARRPLRVAPLP